MKEAQVNRNEHWKALPYNQGLKNPFQSWIILFLLTPFWGLGLVGMVVKYIALQVFGFVIQHTWDCIWFLVTSGNKCNSSSLHVVFKFDAKTGESHTLITYSNTCLPYNFVRMFFNYRRVMLKFLLKRYIVNEEAVCFPKKAIVTEVTPR
jgi:hypothetical protein